MIERNLKLSCIGPIWPKIIKLKKYMVLDFRIGMLDRPEYIVQNIVVQVETLHHFGMDKTINVDEGPQHGGLDLFLGVHLRT